MNNSKVMLKINQNNTAHLFHLIMSILTGGLWIPVWFIVALINSSVRAHYMRQLK